MTRLESMNAIDSKYRQRNKDGMEKRKQPLHIHQKYMKFQN